MANNVGAPQTGSNQPPPEPSKPFTVRTALVLLLALIVGVAAGFLFYSAVPMVGLAVLTGGGAFVGAWTFFNGVIG